MNLTLILAALALALSGCGVVPSQTAELCRLTAIAFDEQDQLAPGWYVNAVKELQKCDYRHTPDMAEGRGFL